MFHCPVGVWVIEQHVGILCATVRSPTVWMGFHEIIRMGRTWYKKQSGTFWGVVFNPLKIVFFIFRIRHCWQHCGGWMDFHEISRICRTRHKMQLARQIHAWQNSFVPLKPCAAEVCSRECFFCRFSYSYCCVELVLAWKFAIWKYPP